MDRPTTGSALWRRLALGAGPMKRSSDRLQFLARILLGCTLLMALPIALAVATATHSQGQAEAVAQAAERQLVDATLTEDAPGAASSNNEIVAPKVRVAIVWTGPYGVEREGHVAVPAGTSAGEVVHIWIDGEGRPTLRPLSEGDVTARSIGVAMLTYLCLALVACGLYLALRTTLDRGRMRRWDADWAVVEPVWTRTVP